MLCCHGRKFFDDNKPKIHLKVKFAPFQSSLTLFHLICQMLAKFCGLKPKGPYLSLEKKSFLCCVHLLHKVGA